METSKNNRNRVNEAAEIADGTGWEAWDAVPRDGPAVFIVDTAAFDHGIVRGRWLSVAGDQVDLRDELTALLGHEPEEGTWAVVDQIGLGAVMAPETMSVDDLTAVAEDLQTGSPA